MISPAREYSKPPGQYCPNWPGDVGGNFQHSMGKAASNPDEHFNPSFRFLSVVLPLRKLDHSPPSGCCFWRSGIAGINLCLRGGVFLWTDHGDSGGFWEPEVFGVITGGLLHRILVRPSLLEKIRHIPIFNNNPVCGSPAIRKWHCLTHKTILPKNPPDSHQPSHAPFRIGPIHSNPGPAAHFPGLLFLPKTKQRLHGQVLGRGTSHL